MDPVVSVRERLFIPGAILAAGIILALTIYWVRSHHHAPVTGNPAVVRPVSPSDHVLGNPLASVMVVEYADIDSSYAKQLQKSMQQLMIEYAPKGNVAWVYRHFPLIDLHPNAGKTALAAECAATLGRTDTFWRFIDLVQTMAPEDNQFDPDNYGEVATQLGIDPATLDACITKGTLSKQIVADGQNALAAGASASPYVVLLVKGQPPMTINGTLPYDSLKKIIDQAVSKSTP